jgi:MFS family permease
MLLIREFGWSRQQIATGGALALLVSGLLAPLVGTIADYRGPRFVILWGTVVAGGAMIWMSRISGLNAAYSAFALFGVGMSGFSLMVMQMLIAQWFSNWRGFATGLVIAGMGLGGAAAPLLAAPILSTHGWRKGFLLQGVALIVIGCPAMLALVRGQRAEARLAHSSGERSIKRDKSGVSYHQALRLPNFWLLAAGSFFSMFAAASALQHIVLYMREQHASLETASRILSLLLLASVAGRLGLGTLSDFLTRRRTLLLAYFILSCGMVMLTLRLGAHGFLIMALLVGVGYGGSVVMMTLSAAEIFGLRSLGQVLGTVVFCFTVGGAVGPIAVGRMADRGLGYRTAFAVALTASILAVFCAAMLRKSPMMDQRSEIA